MRPLFETSKTRLAFGLLGTLIVLHLVAFFFYVQYHQRTLKDVGRDTAIQQVMNIIHMVQATPTGQLPQAIKSINLPQINVELTDKPKFPLRVTDLSFWRINQLIPKGAHEISLSLFVPEGLWVNVKASISTNALWPQLLLLFIEAIIVGILLFYTWSINRFTKPLKSFQLAAQRLGIDTHPTLLNHYKGPAIVRETAQAMNTMQQRIKDLIDNRTLMLAALSHDLRTPITRLKLRANLLNDTPLYHKMIRDLDEMEAMIEEILVFLNNQNQIETEEMKKIDLRSLLLTLCDDFKDMGHDIELIGTHTRIACYARPLTMKRALVNLLQNAVKYGKRAKVYITDPPLTITIEDEGPGIPEQDLTKVFSPFYRCDLSRSRNIAGTGLGLALARDAIRSHNGDITLENMSKGGLRVQISL